ncbi:D-alanyl-D-alanine carboxypeptidase/D-alanyl-D-alanine-endopeptidase [Prolixibacteraceae bacterium Z1-6]|uniref:D-alanyl-D-alanine carboxypeptidase/D-alanyl-D-alanine-endopeptidase n=1 Tax=Draconibacterium aestuarii TaxID=2998507 RepID=A0A9X3FAK2_9BACT|nr:D-alanyl-D-alanine carboxypeptidase/D-alanyl-D-alanine-endopeptidase [Prolixibacteraceae bacterium Z1-6]
MISRFFFTLFFSVLAFYVASQTQFESAVHELLQKPEYKNASVGMHVLDLASGDEVFNLNANQVLVPASTMKLITSGSAFEILGDEYTFETEIAWQGKLNKNGDLKGDLVIVGGADPALGSEYFQDHYMDFLKIWAEKIKASEIKKIKGDLILDASIYTPEKVPDSWVWGDLGNYYGAGPNAFTVYDNMYRITFSSPKNVGKLTKVIAVNPKIERMVISNEVLSADNNGDNAYVFGGPFDKARVIRGTIPRNRDAFTIKASIPQPEEILAQEFLKALSDEGIFMMGEIRFEKVDKKGLETIYIQESPTLAEIGKVLNYESVNLFAEHFLNQIAVEKNGLGDRKEAIKLLKEFWDAKGISTEYLFMEDGSGLSHFNAVAPQFFTEFLIYMAQNKSFVNSLPTAGKGTFKRFDTTLLPGNTLQAKSGSMTRVRCYSGYLKTDSGKTVVFSFMFNHFPGSHSALIKEIQNLFVELKKPE